MTRIFDSLNAEKIEISFDGPKIIEINHQTTWISRYRPGN